jgi:endonuclease-3
VDFDVDIAFARLREAVRPYRKAALFELADDGFNSPFEQLVACILSIRTLDEVTVPVARALFAVARTPEEMVRLTPESIAALIRRTTFADVKARRLHAIATRTVHEHQGALPCDEAALVVFEGVGPKCAHLALGIACGQPLIAVDIHVHRVTNRWGYVRANTPEATMRALEARLPERYRVEINRLLVPFGKHVCTGRAPRCSTCPLLDMCARAGVTSSR